MDENPKMKKNNKTLIIIFLILIVVALAACYLFVEYFNKKDDKNNSTSNTESTIESSTKVVTDISKISKFLNDSGTLYFLSLNAKNITDIDNFINAEYDNEKLMYCIEILKSKNNDENVTVFSTTDIKKIATEKFGSESAIKLKNITSNEMEDCILYKYNASTNTLTSTDDCGSGIIMLLSIQHFLIDAKVVNDKIEVVFNTLTQAYADGPSKLKTPAGKTISYPACDSVYENGAEESKEIDQCSLTTNNSQKIYDSVKSQLDKYKIIIQPTDESYRILNYEIIK